MKKMDSYKICGARRHGKTLAKKEISKLLLTNFCKKWNMY